MGSFFLLLQKSWAKVPKATFQLQSSPCYELSKILTYPTPSSFLSLGPSHQHTCYSSSSAPALLIHTKGLQNHLTYYFIPIPLPFKAHSNQVFYPTTLAWLPMTSMLLTPTVNSLCSLLGTIYHSLWPDNFLPFASPTPHSVCLPIQTQCGSHMLKMVATKDRRNPSSWMCGEQPLTSPDDLHWEIYLYFVKPVPWGGWLL